MATIRATFLRNTSRPFGLVYNSLLDFKEFGHLHPCMKKVEIVEEAASYKVYSVEEVVYLLGFVKIRPAYDARVIELEKNKCIQYTSQVKKNIYLSILFTFSNASDGRLSVKEEIEISSNKLAGTLFLSILKKTHDQVFEKLA